MKYFITKTGLVPFDLTPTELTNILLGNPRHNQIQSVEEQASFILPVNSIEQLMDKPYCLFKHPDMNMENLMEITAYKENNPSIKNINVSGYYLLERVFQVNNKISIVTSLDLYENRQKYKIQGLIVDAPIVKNWERKLIIDTIINDLPE